ncbi:MAG: ABC transporter substrate-binding protein [Bacteroidales bacterium]|nr:ABC transporter substrate-binding protein [Bacteroidales bacterium]
MKRHKFLVISYWLLVFIYLLTGCKGTPQDETITIATLRGPSAVGMIKMIDDPPEIHGRKLSFIINNEPVKILPLISQGKVDFAILPSNLAAIVYNQGVDYQLAAIPVFGTLYLFGKDTTISDWNDLHGKTIYSMGKGMTPDAILRFLLQKNGLDPDKDVTIDYSFPSHIELAHAVASGYADLAVISEPLVSMVMARNKEVISIFDFNEEWNKITAGEVPLAQTALLVNKTFAKKHPKSVKKFLKLYEESEIWINENMIEGATYIVKHNILPDTSTALASIPKCNIHFARAIEIKPSIDEYFAIFYNFNPELIGGKIPDEAFYFKE